MKTITGFIFALCLLSLSCHESLPPRQDPGDVFVGTLEAQYVINPYANNVRLCVRVVNIYDETLQDKLLLGGNLILTLVRDTSFHKTIVLSDSNVFTGRYDRTTRTMTIDPGERVAFRYIWDFSDDQGRDMRSAFSYYADPECPLRDIADETLLLTGKIRVFDHTRSVSFPSILIRRHFTNISLPATVCPLVASDPPCN